MSEDSLIRYGAPTLAGIKTGNLFMAECPDRTETVRQIGGLNRILVPKGLRLIPLRFMKKKVLLYLYRPSFLQRDLSNSEASELLREAGYTDMRISKCLSELIRRLNMQQAFPHEIGLFLSYPPEDVRGFIHDETAGCGRRKCKCTGCWKVYGDVGRARRLFDLYNKCTNVYCRHWEDGATVEKLAVSV